MTIGQLILILAFVISVALNRALVDHAVCFCLAVAIPLGFVFILAGSHRPSGQEATEFWLLSLLSASALAALGFLFRKRPRKTQPEDSNA